MGDIYVTSDLHFNHNKDFCYIPRNCNSVEEMNEKIVKNWNSIVKEDDFVYVLGDLMFGADFESGINLIKQLNGTLCVILGNHDTSNRVEAYTQCPNVVIIGLAGVLKYKKYKFYLSHYPTLCGNYDVEKPLYRKIINLCGHTHTTDKFCDMNKDLIYHVELDAHDCKPVKIDDVIKDLKQKIEGSI